MVYYLHEGVSDAGSLEGPETRKKGEVTHVFTQSINQHKL